MKTPKKKKNKKAKDTFKDIETIDLTTSPASSSAPASSPSTRLDGYSVPNSPTNAAAADKAAMPPPSRPGGKSTYQPQGPNADQSGAGTDRPIPSPATTETPGNQTPRRNFSMACKVKVMELCLASKDIYLKMTPSPSFDQKPFWEHVLQGIESDPATRSLFKDWRDVRCYVDVWAQPRRSNLRENNLPAPSPGQPELDRAIDKWNLVFAQRFCVINQGYFESSIWTLAEEHIISIMQSEIQTWIAGALQKRMEELERYARPVLGYNRAPDDYNNPTRRLFYRSQAANPDDAMQVRETEGLISLVLDLQPRLRSAISEYIRNGESNGHGDNGQSSDGFQADDERQGSGHYEHTQHEVVPSIETPAPAPGYGRAPGYYSRNDRGISSSPRSGRSRGRSKKRKKPDQGQSTPSTNNLSIRTRVLPGYGDSTGSGPKRQRVNEAGPVWARDTSDNPFVTPQPRRRAHRPESPGRFREETAEFNNMTPDSKADMLFKAIKEIRREK
ncbi:hypothetical protein N0V84_004142 [Fusarium piperis]|uniref:Uncharacterized protein n=1 Tax=Fusarium piperis TaxID=1435070 RepID=A0A9W8WGG3_9HYPO|nr:hypothetical protein N0V84_004142 [Fusarium piperis]